MTSRRAGVFVVVIFAAWLGAQAEVQIYAGKTMGSTFAVKWHGGPDAGAIRAIVDDELAVADSTFSQWRDDSEIQRFNRHYSTAPFAASERLRAAVAIALQVAVATDGAFDPTVKPIVDLFRAQQADHSARAAKPSEAALAAAREQVGYAKLKVIGETLKKDAPSLMIDLDGLVAGFVADRLGSRLSQVFVKGYLLEITGEVLAHGQKPDGAPWLGGIVDPLRSEPLHERALVTVPLRERALCTSGVYRNFIEQNGVITSHIFDPRTGKNATHGVVSVSVLANSCALADAFGTALLVLGPDAAWLAIARCAEPSMGAFLSSLTLAKCCCCAPFCGPRCFHSMASHVPCRCFRTQCAVRANANSRLRSLLWPPRQTRLRQSSGTREGSVTSVVFASRSKFSLRV